MSSPHPSRPPWPSLALTAAIPLFVVAAMFIFQDVQISLMTRDPTGIAGIHPLSGFLSSLGVLLWWTAASVWLFCALMHRISGDAPRARFALASGALSMYLGLDDLFQLHERIAPNHLGVPERWVLAAIVLSATLYLWHFRHEIRRAQCGLLVAAVVFLAASVAFDGVLASWAWRVKGWSYFLEDGSKWVGICFWCGFAVTRCRADMLEARAARATTRR